MTRKLWISYQNIWYIFQIQCLQSHLETLSLWWLFSLQLLCPASALAISSHWYSICQILKAHSSLHSSFCPKSHFGRAFLHSSLWHTPFITIICLVCACVCVCVQTPFKSLDEIISLQLIKINWKKKEFRWKKDFSHHPHVPSTWETVWLVLIIRKHLWIN